MQTRFRQITPFGRISYIEQPHRTDLTLIDTGKTGPISATKTSLFHLSRVNTSMDNFLAYFVQNRYRYTHLYISRLIFGHMLSWILINIGLVLAFFPEGSKPLPESIRAYHQRHPGGHTTQRKRHFMSTAVRQNHLPGIGAHSVEKGPKISIHTITHLKYILN